MGTHHADSLPRQQSGSFHAVSVHAPPGTYVVEAADSLAGAWYTNADVFMGSLTNISYSTNTGYIWTNTATVDNLVVDTNGLARFYVGTGGTNASRFYRVRRID
jgi:hypothetical protein